MAESEYTGTTALIEALSDWRRNAVALLVAIGTVAAAAYLGSREAYYLAAMVVFTVWMGWFVLTGIEWVKRADF